MTIILAKRVKYCVFSGLPLGKNTKVNLKFQASEASEEKILDFYA